MLEHKSKLQQRLTTNKGFKNEMDQVEEKYRQLLQRALYTDMDDINFKVIVDAGKDEDQHAVFFVFGRQQPKKKKCIDKFYMYLVKVLDEKINLKQYQPFSIIYFNTCCDSYTNYTTFRNIYRTLPLKYFQNLKKLIIVDPSFTVKAMQWFVSGTINKVLHDLTIYVNDLKEIKQHNIILTTNKLSLLPIYITSEKQKQIARLSVRQSMFVRISKKVPEKRKPTKKLKLDDYQINQIGVPMPLYLMISYFLMRKQSLKQQGLFRKSVVKSEVDQGMQLIKQRYYDFLQQITNPHTVANLLTRFIRDFEEPLIPIQIYNKLIHDQGKSNQISYLIQTFQSLPMRNKVTMIYLFDFLLQQVVPFKQLNKMTTYNLSVVFSPCLLNSGKQLAIQQLMYSKKLVIIVQFIFNNYSQIFGQKQQRLNLFRQSSKIQKQRFIEQNIKQGGNNEQQSDEQQQQENQEQQEDVLSSAQFLERKVQIQPQDLKINQSMYSIEGKQEEEKK